MKSPLSFLILVICVFAPFAPAQSGYKGLSTSLIFSKNQVVVSLFFASDFLFSSLFSFALTFIFSSPNFGFNLLFFL